METILVTREEGTRWRTHLVEEIEGFIRKVHQSWDILVLKGIGRSMIFEGDFLCSFWLPDGRQEVAKRLGRDYVGIELNEKYVRELIEPRLAGIDPLFVKVAHDQSS